MPSNGYGNAPFGVAPFGLWMPDATGPNIRTRVNARKLDPLTRAPLIEDGSFVEDDPVRQRVLLAIRTTRGSIPGLENWGSDLPAITHKDQRFAERVRSSVARALEAIAEVELLEVVPDPKEILITYRIRASGESETITL